MQKQFLAIIIACLVLTGCMSSGPPPSLASGNCTNLCSERWWKTASTADLKAELKSGANVNARDKDGTTPLHNAARYNKPAHTKILIDAGAELSSGDKYAHTPLFYAVSWSGNDSLKVLLDAGASPDVRNLTGHTSLHLAVIVNNITGLKALLDAGANPSVRDENGSTPMWIATQDANGEAMTTLALSQNFTLKSYGGG